jgi:rare lipoprotein A
LFVQAGAFADPANAQRLADKLKRRLLRQGSSFATTSSRAASMYRVRIGPVPDVPEFDRIVVCTRASRRA